MLAVAGGARGRRAALDGVASVALTSTIVNAVLKPLAGRRRPDREIYPRADRTPREDAVTRSFPSGHAASAFAFASGVATAAPDAGIGVTALAMLVACSRVHTGVHYPGDVIVGSVIGAALGPVASAAVNRSMAAP